MEVKCPHCGSDAKHKEVSQPENPVLLDVPGGVLLSLVYRLSRETRFECAQCGTRCFSYTNLAVEIERHLNVEPVMARPPSNYYRFHRWTRRHKPAVIVASAVAGCLAMVAVVLFEVVGAYFQPPLYRQGYRLHAWFDSVATIHADSVARHNFVDLKVGSPNAPRAFEGAYLLREEEAASSNKGA